MAVAKYQTESPAFLRTPKIDRHIVRMPTIDLTLALSEEGGKEEPGTREPAGLTSYL